MSNQAIEEQRGTLHRLHHFNGNILTHIAGEREQIHDCVGHHQQSEEDAMTIDLRPRKSDFLSGIF